jgi:hypothetical protein
MGACCGLCQEFPREDRSGLASDLQSLLCVSLYNVSLTLHEALCDVKGLLVLGTFGRRSRWGDLSRDQLPGQKTPKRRHDDN